MMHLVCHSDHCGFRLFVFAYFDEILLTTQLPAFFLKLVEWSFKFWCDFTWAAWYRHWWQRNWSQWLLTTSVSGVCLCKGFSVDGCVDVTTGVFQRYQPEGLEPLQHGLTCQPATSGQTADGWSHLQVPVHLLQCLHVPGQITAFYES